MKTLGLVHFHDKQATIFTCIAIGGSTMRIPFYVLMIIVGTATTLFSQEDRDYREYIANRERSPFIVKFSVGTGAAFGGWYGINSEFGITSVSLLAALGATYPNTMVNATSNTTGDISSYQKKCLADRGARLPHCTTNKMASSTLTLLWASISLSSRISRHHHCRYTDVYYPSGYLRA